MWWDRAALLDLGPIRRPGTGAVQHRMKLEPLGLTNQVGQRAGPHRRHDPGAVHLDRLFARTKLRGHLLVEESGHHQTEDLLLAGSQAVVAAPEPVELLPLL